MKQKLKKSALRYRNNYGFSIFPVNPESKKPLIDSWKPYQSDPPTVDQIEKWWNKWPKAAIGIATGPVSGLLVLDVDHEKGWEYVTEEKRLGSEPTPIARSGGGGWHVYYKYPEGADITIGARIGNEDLGLDFRGRGGYVIAPPSSHPSGDAYEWDQLPKEYPPTMPPDWLMEELENKNNGHGDVDRLLKGVGKGHRNNAATKVAGRYLAKFDEENWDLALDSLKAWNQRNDPPLPEDELEKTFKSIAKKENSKSEPPDKDEKDKKTIHEKLLEISEEADLFRTANNRMFAEITEDGKPYVFEIKHKGASGGNFRHWLIRNYKRRYGEGPNSTSVSRTMEAVRADCDIAEERKVYKRIADLGDRILLDLAGKQRKAVEITPEGYSTVEIPDINFWRPDGARELPEPRGSVEDLGHLWNLFNVEAEDFSLLVAWLLATFQTAGPYPVLIPTGPAGSGKSTLTKLIRNLLDPAGTTGRVTTKSIQNSEDLFSVAKHRHLLTLDNISRLRQWQSDALSAIATGGGLEKRQLYSDDSLSTIDTMNPILMNGIDISGMGDDLLDRAIFLHLEEPSVRVEEEKIWDKFERHHGKILGGLCDALTTTLANRHQVELTKEEMTRMADFTKWVKAARPAIQKIEGLKDVDPLANYHDNRSDAGRDALLDSELGSALVEFLESIEPNDNGILWEGKTSELLEKLEKVADQKAIESKEWPGSAVPLGKRLKRIKTTLEKVGIIYEKDRSNRGAINKFYREVPF